MGRTGYRITKSRRSQSESAKQTGATGLPAISLAGLPVGLHWMTTLFAFARIFCSLLQIALFIDHNIKRDDMWG